MALLRNDPFGTRLLVALGAMLAIHASPAMAAQRFPSQPIKIVVPFAPGGAVDTVGRTLAEQLAKQLGQPVLVENKPGAHANIGTHDVVRASPDGYTLLLGANGLATNPALDKKLPFNPRYGDGRIARRVQGRGAGAH